MKNEEWWLEGPPGQGTGRYACKRVPSAQINGTAFFEPEGLDVVSFFRGSGSFNERRDTTIITCGVGRCATPSTFRAGAHLRWIRLPQ